jgi:hypothetical protein
MYLVFLKYADNSGRLVANYAYDTVEEAKKVASSASRSNIGSEVYVFQAIGNIVSRIELTDNVKVDAVGTGKVGAL